nr:MAG TPA: hypothetical protein [Caudoviricetes sp.]
METVKTLFDGILPVKPFSYVYGIYWNYLYTDSFKGIEFNVYKHISGEMCVVLTSEII